MFQYSISGKVEDLVCSEQAFRPFAAQVRINVESVLRDYEIDDAATKRSLLGTLAALAARLEGVPPIPCVPVLFLGDAVPGT